MKLIEILSTLNGDDMTAMIYDRDSGDIIISMDASGYAALDADLKQRTVAHWFVVNGNTIKVVVDPVTNTIPLTPDDLTGSVVGP